METELDKLEKEVNLMILLANSLIERMESVEAIYKSLGKSMKFKSKLRLNQFIKACNALIKEMILLSNQLTGLGKDISEKQYKEAMNTIHLFSNRLDDFLLSMYDNG